MKKLFVLTLFLLVSLAWAVAQQQDPASQSAPAGSSGQASSPSMSGSDQSASPSSQSQTSSDQSSQPQSGQSTTAPSQAPSMPPSSSQAPAGAMGDNGAITEGCLGGSSPNYTLTAKDGTTYKLNLPANADASKLTAHVGESVQVQGTVNKASSASTSTSGAASSTTATSEKSIDVSRIGKGTGTCPNAPGGAAAPPKQ